MKPALAQLASVLTAFEQCFELGAGRKWTEPNRSSLPCILIRIFKGPGPGQVTYSSPGANTDEAQGERRAAALARKATVESESDTSSASNRSPGPRVRRRAQAALELEFKLPG